MKKSETREKKEKTKYAFFMNYPHHLEDPLRKRIAIEYAKHELRKLLSSMKDARAWSRIDDDIAHWPAALSAENFWNGIHGISLGFRLTNIISWVTSRHVEWREETVEIRNLEHGGKEIREQPRNEAPEEKPPIFVIRKKGNLKVIDGNTRVALAQNRGEKTIRAFIGEPTQKPVFFDHWVPTSLLVDIVFWYRKQLQEGVDTTGETARVIAELIRNSSPGRHQFKTRTVWMDKEEDVKLLEEVTKLLGK